MDALAFVSQHDLMTERNLRKQSAARLKELQDYLAELGEPQRQKTVPHEALHAERERRLRSEARVEELEAEVSELRARLADDAR